MVDLYDVDQWIDAIRSLFTDEDRYEGLVAAALRHSEGPEIDPVAVTAAFEMILVGVRERAERRVS